jgi:hypothetical protein
MTIYRALMIWLDINAIVCLWFLMKGSYDK